MLEFNKLKSTVQIGLFSALNVDFHSYSKMHTERHDTIRSIVFVM